MFFKRNDLVAKALTALPVIFAAAASTAQAQAQPAQAPATAPSAAPADAAPLADIVVTGTRIQRLDFKLANPIVAIDAKQFQQSGQTDITQYLARIPALVGSFGQDQAAGGNSSIGIGETGLEELNLRNLGSKRTLVLINGRRQVGGEAGETAVDINTIPSSLIDRVDVLTGGASAIYGADGVTGVVNFVLKQKFEGLDVNGEYGDSQHGGGSQRLFSVTYGKNFADGRGNITLNYEYGRQGRLKTTDRPYLSGTRAVTFHDTPFDTGPSRIPLSNVRFNDTSRMGGIDTDLDGIPDFVGNGDPYDGGLPVPPFYQQGGNGTLQSDYRGDLIARSQRHVINLIGHFDVSDKLTLYAEAKYVHTTSFSTSQPSFDYYLHISPDNPFIPASLQSAISQAAATNEANGDGNFVFLNRDNFDLGTRAEKITRDTLRGVLGAKGDLSPHLHYDVSFEYSQNKIVNHIINDQYTDQFFASVDAVPDGHGGVTCRINMDPTADLSQPDDYVRTLQSAGTPITFSPGSCVPLNLFGEGSPSQAAIDFITARNVEHTKLTQQVLSGSLAGDLGNFLKLPGGSIGFALGGEYRRETSKDVPDIVSQEGLTFSNLTPIAQGKFNVAEAFAEIDLPVLKDVPFAKLLDFGAAARFSHYSTVGNTTTWRFNGQYAPVSDITFRGTIAQAVRAPNISELFSPNTQDFEFITDPCDKNNLNLGKSTRAANCATLLSGLGANPATFVDPNSSNISGLSVGNPKLKAETARTWTAGVVFKPHFVPGLTMSVDWYDIKLKQAIILSTPQNLANLCVNSPTLNNEFCPNIVRASGGDSPGGITSFTSTYQNVSQFSTSGLDLNLAYILRTEKLGTFNFNVVGNYLNKLQEIPVPGGEAIDLRGTYDTKSTDQAVTAPRYQANIQTSWLFHKFTLSYNLSWFSKTLRYSHDEVNGDPDLTAQKYKHFKDRFQHDIYAAVDIGDQFEIYGGINNLTDEKPDLGQESYPISALGRFFFIGAKVKLRKFL